MKYPTLKELATSRDMISNFGGYNHNLRIGDGEFYDMTNLSSADYPLLSPRKKRGIYATTSNKPQGLIAKDALCYVNGSAFVINGYPVDMGLDLNTPKTLVSMGAYVIIMPDKKYINTTKNEIENAFEFGNIEASVSINSIGFNLCNKDGEAIGLHYSQIDMPKIDTDSAEEYDGKYWLQFEGGENPKPIALKQYSATNKQWFAVDTYLSISTHGESRPDFNSFEVGDSVIISGIEEIDKVRDLNGEPQIIVGRKPYAIWIKGIIGEPFDEGSVADKLYQTDYQSFYYDNVSVTIQRKMPNLDFIIESQNRLWGCRYGVEVNGEVVNEIYASKLGDFKNWQNFAGISTDSWVAGVGTDGQFTGAVNYLGYPVFFKDNCIHKVYGNYPAQYQIQTTMCRGVQQGCEKSLAIVNEMLYYKSRHAICTYDGSLPQEISSMLGDVSYYNAVGGSLGNKYYISMTDDNNESHLFVCDTARGMWHREDNTKVQDFCECRGNLYFVEEVEEDGEETYYKIKSINVGDNNPEYGAIKWMAESGIWGTDQPDKKYISRLDVRMSLNVGTRVVFLIQYDSSGVWEHLFTMMGSSLRTFTVPVKPRRCDHFRLRIEGDGEAKIYSICRTIEQGSDV